MDETGMRRVAAAIVLKAVKDWRSLIRAHAWEEKYSIYNKNFEELRSFFKSDYCQALLSGAKIAPEDLLAILEKELAEAQTNPKPRKLPSNFELNF